MTKYSLFLAGATNLDNERNVFRSVVSKWNATEELYSGTKAVLFTVLSYENFDDTIDTTTGQHSYNLFIANEADVAAFILNGVIGDKTLEEFEVAYKSLESSRKAPAIIVFTKNGQNDKNIQIIKELVESHNQYYIKYDSEKELEHLIGETLRKFVARKKNSKYRPLRSFWNKHRKICFIGIISFLVLLCLGGTLFIRNISITNQAKEAIEYYRRYPTNSSSYKKLKEAKEQVENSLFLRGRSINDDIDKCLDSFN